MHGALATALLYLGGSCVARCGPRSTGPYVHIMLLVWLIQL